jgi:cytidine deaminase
VAVDEALVQAAIDLVERRFAAGVWRGAAAMYTHEGSLLTSTFVSPPNAGADLCYETGAICEAHKLGERVTASVCVALDPKGNRYILTPCGICQERLFTFGPNVEVGVPHPDDPSRWLSKSLGEAQPFYWAKVFHEPQ